MAGFLALLLRPFSTVDFASAEVRSEMNDPTATVVHLAGALGVEYGERRATERDLPGRQPRLLFAALALNRGRVIPHEELADIMWPGELPSTWQPALRTLVSKVRSVFELVGLDGASIVSGEPGRYRFDPPDGTIVDIETAIAQVAEAAEVLKEGGSETARRLAGEARSVLSRPLLAGVDVPWVDRKRDEMAVVLVHCLEILGECRRRAGEYDHAVPVVEDILRREPFREPAWRLLMRIHAQAGNIAEALKSYERCRALLADELGTDPSSETQELHLRILTGAQPPDTHPAAEQILPTAVPPIAGPPYRGLRHFDEDHAPVFFGRDIEVDALVDRLRDHRFVAVVGPSGSGKSSLVRAGLLPALRAGALPDADTWQRIVVVPGSEPLDSLATGLLKARLDDAVRAAADRLGQDAAALHDAAAALLTGTPAEEHVLIVVDQFEEIFTLCRDEEARRRFITEILEATRRRDARVVVVLTLRADFYGHAAAYPELADALSTSQVLVPPLDGDGVQLAIEGPARLTGLRFEDGLVGRILGDVAGEPGALPLLQHALLALYERRADHVLTRATYDDLGGVSGALAVQAEELWEELTTQQQDIVRRIMLRLTEPGHGTEDTRRRATLEELVTEPQTAPATEAVIDELARGRLVVASADPTTGSRSVEIAHEALLRGWPRLATWIDEDRAGLILHRRLTEAAREWDTHDRHPDFLLSGARLAEVRGWGLKHDANLNPLERTFLSASVEAEEFTSRRRARIRRLLTTGLLVALFLVGALALIASAQRDRANREEELARSREVAAEAVSQLDLDPELGLLLAIEAYQTSPTAQAEAALRQTLVRSTIRARLQTDGADPMVEIGPDGGLTATWELDGPVTIWSADGTRLAELRDAAGEPLPGPINGMAFSPDGKRLLASNLDGTSWIWSLPEGELLRTLEWPKSGVVAFVIAQEGVGWAPDGSRVVVAGSDGVARLYDVGSGEELEKFIGPGGRGSFLARARFSPDGLQLAVEGAAGRVRVFDLETGGKIADTDGHDAHLWSLKFSSDGTRLLTAGDDGSARLWEVSSGTLLHSFGHDSPVRDAAIDRAGTRVLTGDSNGFVRIWDAATGERLFDLVGHEARVNQLRFHASGRLALTASLDGTARIWDTGSGDLIATMLGSTQPVVDAEFSPGGDFIVTSGDDPRIWRVPQGAVSAIEAHDASLHDITLSRDGLHLVTGGTFDGIARIFRLGDGEEVATLEHAAGSKLWVDVSPDGSKVLTVATYASPGLAQQPDPPQIWDIHTGDLLKALPLPEDDPLSVCGGHCAAGDAKFSPDGTRVAVGGFDGRVGIFDALTGEELSTMEPEAGFVYYVDWAPDGRTLLVVAAGAELGFVPLVIEAATGEVLHSLPQQVGLSSGTASFSPDGSLIATSVGATVRVYEIPSERLVAELRHRGAARDAAFSSDGTLLISASESDTSIWDLASQRRLIRLPGPGAFTVAFTPDEQQIAVGGSDGVVRFYRCDVCLPVDQLLTLARERVTRNLTPTERERFLHETGGTQE